MADFFTTVAVSPVDKAVAAQQPEQNEVRGASVVSNQSESAQPTKATGSNFSMCEIIM